MQKAMHAGVIRDVEQQRVKKERLADFQIQQELEQEYRKIQSVSGGGSNTVGKGAPGRSLSD
jgi:protein PET117